MIGEEKEEGMEEENLAGFLYVALIDKRLASLTVLTPKCVLDSRRLLDVTTSAL